MNMRLYFIKEEKWKKWYYLDYPRYSMDTRIDYKSQVVAGIADLCQNKYK